MDLSAILAVEAERIGQIQNLARAFNALQQAEGIEPWDAIHLDGWATAGKPRPQVHSVQFVLAVWNQNAARDELYMVGPFDCMRALQYWDEHDRSVFLEWARSPWWC